MKFDREVAESALKLACSDPDMRAFLLNELETSVEWGQAFIRVDAAVLRELVMRAAPKSKKS